MNDAQLHGTTGTKYSSYRPGLLGMTAATIPALYSPDLDAKLPLRCQHCEGLRPAYAALHSLWMLLSQNILLGMESSAVL